MTTPTPTPEPGRGLFIVFEGGDGAGKTTQADQLDTWLTRHGHHVTRTREPGGTELGRSLRELLLHGTDGSVSPRAEALIFAADRAHHVTTLIRPALTDGHIVISDRYMDSSVAYQGAARQLGHDEIRDLSLWATEHLLPDLTILLDVPANEGRARRGDVHDRLERESDQFHTDVRIGFRSLADRDPGRYLVLDATLPVDDLAGTIRDRVSTLLPETTVLDGPDPVVVSGAATTTGG